MKLSMEVKEYLAENGYTQDKDGQRRSKRKTEKLLEGLKEDE